MITVGRRSAEGDAWEEQGRLARTAGLLRGHPGLVPRGVYRFDSFEEADAWLTRTTIACLGRRSPQDVIRICRSLNEPVRATS